MPAVCPDGTHETNEAEFFQPGCMMVFHVLVNSAEQEWLLQQPQLDKQPLHCNREKSAACTVDLKRQV